MGWAKFGGCQLKEGDLIRMRHQIGNHQTHPGVILSFELQGKWARVFWSDDGLALEKIRDLEVIGSESTD